jgi:hypothetical protein
MNLSRKSEICETAPPSKSPKPQTLFNIFFHTYLFDYQSHRLINDNHYIFKSNTMLYFVYSFQVLLLNVMRMKLNQMTITKLELSPFQHGFETLQILQLSLSVLLLIYVQIL